jgi:hypothetical protein
MPEAFALASGGTVGLLVGWVYWEAYRTPDRNSLTAFISAWYARHAFSFLGGPLMLRILAISFITCGALLWCGALWNALIN